MRLSLQIRGVLALSAALLLVLSGIAMAGDARRETPGAAEVERETFAQSQAAVEAYWTPERMRAAEPLDTVLTHEPQQEADAQASLPSGQPASFAPAEPGEASYAVHLGAEAREDLFTVSSYPFPYTRYEQSPPYDVYPYSTMGRLFFTTPLGDSSCSGTVVVSTHGSLVWTAGHCLHQGGGGDWHSNFAFVPAYRDGNRPLGTWTGVAGTVLTDWSIDGNFRYDLAGLELATNSSGQVIQQVTGAQGIKFNWGLYWYTNFGYPAQFPFNGQRMIVCVANWAVQDNPPGSGPLTIGKGCDMTGGASGGGWHTDFSSTQGGYVESVNSYKYGTQPEAIYGPYHGDGAHNLYLFVR